MTIDRRTLLGMTSATAACAAAAVWFRPFGASNAQAGETFEVTKTEEEWRQALTPQQFAVLRKHGTEQPHSVRLKPNTARERLTVPGVPCLSTVLRQSLKAARVGRAFTITCLMRS